MIRKHSGSEQSSQSNSKKQKLLPSSNQTEKTSNERERKKKIDKISADQKMKKKFNFLDNPVDDQKRAPDHPDYDPSTVFIPPTCYSEMSAFEKQYWVIKAKHFDTVVFFKKGKFYELFERDADIGHRVLGLKMTDRVSMKMVGVPVNSFEYWSTQLLSLGYKVAVVDQIESPLEMAKRTKVEPKDSTPKVLTRELNKVITPGTVVDEAFLRGHNSLYLLAITEREQTSEFGIVYADTSTGAFHLSFFVDDTYRTQLRTLIIRITPKEILYDRSKLSSDTLKILKQNLQYPIFSPIKQPWSVQETIDSLTFNDYFIDPKEPNNSSKELWPNEIREIEDNELVVGALGLVIKYLSGLKIDKQLISLKKFSIVNILENSDQLILDGKALRNLEILENDYDRGTDGTLLHLLCKPKSAFGKRLMKRWICHPLKIPDQINQRLDAVGDFIGNPEFAEKLQKLLKGVPDLERILSRVHACTSTLTEFLSILDAFEAIQAVIYNEIIVDLPSLVSSRLKKLLTVGEELPDWKDLLAQFCESFDRDSAKNLGKIKPLPGFDPDYDESVAAVNKIEAELNNLLREQQKHFKSSKVVFRDIGKTLYLIEVPIDILKTISPPSYLIKASATQKVQRFIVPKIKDMLPSLENARAELSTVERNVLRYYLTIFDQYYNQWIKIVECLSEVDCLLSLSECSGSYGNMCRPQIVEGHAPFLEIENLSHPCVAERLGDSFIPNNIYMGAKGEPNVILLTGPNMGGKSTILRQVCIAVILAQLGCYIPATKYRGTIVDRIFTRLGASDNIFEKQSTFMVELQETASVLNDATEHSLIILDELGRGTSTFDGYAIAYAVLDDLSLRSCRVLFSTHYHMLTEEYKDNKLISLCHMDALVDEKSENVTFLYKMKKGVCPKSYGMKVAHMAGIPKEIQDRAKEKSTEFESISSLSLYRNYTKRLITKQHDISNMKHIFNSNREDFEQFVSILKQRFSQPHH